MVEQAIAGDVAAVSRRTSPELRAQVSLAEVERLFAGLISHAAIGARVEERTVALGPGRGVSFADHRWGEDRLRFTVAIGREGLGMTVAPVQPLPPDPRRGRPARATRSPPTNSTPTTWRAGRAGATFRGDGRGNADYWAWGGPVLAPAGATVVTVRDGVPDNRRPGLDTNVLEPAGNHVILDLGGGEYALLAHFREGSIRVRAGQHVRAGDVLGRCGNSGNSSEPHLHLHLQDRPEFRPGGATGLPIRFERYFADGVPHALGAPTSGQFVRAMQG